MVENENGKPTGMLSRIVEKRSPEYTSIEHFGMVEDGIDKVDSEEVKKWAPAYENYSLTEKEGGTEFTVEMDVADAYRDFFEQGMA